MTKVDRVEELKKLIEDTTKGTVTLTTFPTLQPDSQYGRDDIRDGTMEYTSTASLNVGASTFTAAPEQEMYKDEAEFKTLQGLRAMLESTRFFSPEPLKPGYKAGVTH